MKNFVDMFAQKVADGTINLIWDKNSQMLRHLVIDDTIIGIDYDYHNVSVEWFLREGQETIQTRIVKGNDSEFIQWIREAIESKRVFFSSSYHLSKKSYFLIQEKVCIVQNFYTEEGSYLPHDDYFANAEFYFGDDALEDYHTYDEYEA